MWSGRAAENAETLYLFPRSVPNCVWFDMWGDRDNLGEIGRRVGIILHTFCIVRDRLWALELVEA